jgi:L-alanine-DL-glutamate epimerase-like enolase superfamily enzyme
LMRIRGLTLHSISIARRTGQDNHHVIVRLETDEVVGWGEMSDLSHSPMYQIDLPALEGVLNDLLVDEDPRNLSRLEQRMTAAFPVEGHKYARSGLIQQGVDLALHDAAGRLAGVSVSTMLGGALRHRFPACYPIFRMSGPAEIESRLVAARHAKELGFKVVRFYVGTDAQADAELLQRLQEEVGGDLCLKSLDFGGIATWRDALARAEQLARVIDFEIVESVAPAWDINGLREFRRRSRWPVSEHVYGTAHARELVRSDAVDILNLSPYVLGGVRPTMRLVDFAETVAVDYLFGTTQELSLGTAAIAHLGAAAPSARYAADSTGPCLYIDDVVQQRVQYADGDLIVPDGPGLGLVVDEDHLRELSALDEWRFDAKALR